MLMATFRGNMADLSRFSASVSVLSCDQREKTLEADNEVGDAGLALEFSIVVRHVCLAAPSKLRYSWRPACSLPHFS